jgi:hypothetical protein
MKLALLLIGLAALCVPQTQPGPARDFRISLSVSPFTELVFRTGVTFTDGQSLATNPEELQQLFVKYGANEVYARIATTRAYRTGVGDHSLNRVLNARDWRRRSISPSTRNWVCSAFMAISAASLPRISGTIHN